MNWLGVAIMLGMLSFVELLLVVVQRRALRDRHRAIAAYRDELLRANELMAIMAREDVAKKRNGAARSAEG